MNQGRVIRNHKPQEQHDILYSKIVFFKALGLFKKGIIVFIYALKQKDCSNTSIHQQILSSKEPKI